MIRAIMSIIKKETINEQIDLQYETRNKREVIGVNKHSFAADFSLFIFRSALFKFSL